MINEEKQKALEAALGHIEKQYGKGSVMKLGDSSSNMVVEAVPTGSLGLDIALGVGGVPKGRFSSTTNAGFTSFSSSATTAKASAPSALSSLEYILSRAETYICL